MRRIFPILAITVALTLIGMLGYRSFAREQRSAYYATAQMERQIQTILRWEDDLDDLTEAWDLYLAVATIGAHSLYYHPPHMRWLWTDRIHMNLYQVSREIRAYELPLRALVFYPEDARPDEKEQVKTLMANLKKAGWDKYYIRPHTLAGFNERASKFLELTRASTEGSTQ